MYIRETSGQTLEDVRNELRENEEQAWEGIVRELSADVESENPVLRAGSREIALNTQSQLALAKFAGIPTKFYERVEPDERQFMLTNRLNRLNDEQDVVVRYNRDGFSSIYPASKTYIDPARVAEVLLEVFPPSSEVIEWWNNSDELRLDVTHDSELYVGGDPSVGDITRGGVRIVQNKSNGVSPMVQPYLYRLVCTNGMEVPDHSIKVEARGRNANEVLASLEYGTYSAVEKLNQEIEAFYALQNEVVEDPTQAMLRIGNERGLSALTTNRLASDIPSDETHTMFDLVNRVTNYANHPDLAGSPAQRRRLELAGGGLVATHSERCAHCAQTL